MNLPTLIDTPWLPDWRPDQKLPADTTRAALEQRASEVEAALSPGGAEGVVVATERLFAFGRGFGQKYDAEQATRFYVDQLGEHPGWAIAEAVDAVLRDWRDKYRLPMPAEISKRLPKRLWDLRGERVRIGLALRALDAGRIEAVGPVADIGEVRECMAQVLQSLRGK